MGREDKTTIKIESLLSIGPAVEKVISRCSKSVSVLTVRAHPESKYKISNSIIAFIKIALLIFGLTVPQILQHYQFYEQLKDHQRIA